MKRSKLLMLSSSALALIYIPFLSSASTIYIGGGRAELANTLVNQNGIELNMEDKADYLRLGWEFQNKTFLFGLGASGLRYSGVATSNGGSIEADSYHGYIETGYSHRLSQALHFDFLTGYDKQFSEKSQWDSCSNCEQSAPELETATGLYFLPRLRFQASSGLMLSVAYQYYSDADVNDVLSLNIGISY